MCLILSVYVIVLSTRPCCSDNDCQGKIAAKKELSDKSPAKEKECPGCSPFFTCGTCVGFIVSKPLTINSPVIPENHTEYNTAYQQPYIEKVALSIWLPPKIS
jgi:hypothetical protein